MNELEILLEHYQTADEESAELLQAYIHQRTEKANEAEESEAKLSVRRPSKAQERKH
jgi:hypothetical protein